MQWQFRERLRPSIRLGVVAVGLLALLGADHPMKSGDASPLFIGVIARTSACPGSFIVLQRGIDQLVHSGPRFRQLPASTDPSIAGALSATLKDIRQRLDPDHFWLFVGRADGTPQVLLEIPDRPADQIDFWSAVQNVMLHASE